jgi:hypothetical protein
VVDRHLRRDLQSAREGRALVRCRAPGCRVGSRSVDRLGSGSPTLPLRPPGEQMQQRGARNWTTASSPGSVAPDSMQAHASSPRPRESDTRCTGLDTDSPDTTRRQFGLTDIGCQSRLTAMNAEDIASAIASNDPSLGLRAALALHRLAERVEADHVASAREKGWSWQQIGDALGVTRQSVHTKYNKESS